MIKKTSKMNLLDLCINIYIHIFFFISNKLIDIIYNFTYHNYYHNSKYIVTNHYQ